MENLRSKFAHATPIRDTKTAEQRYAELKEKAQYFRVLVIGRANAGKTTILKKICNTTDDPEIYDRYGKKVDTELEPTAQRGLHDIENEMVFRSNPTFIFHDSRGFEAGGVEEFVKVKEFVSKRSQVKKLRDQVHVIWYCISMDDDRPIQFAENKFFSELGTGKVPVVVVFTKCEALEIKAIEILEEEGYDYDKAVENAQKYADENLKTIHKALEKKKYPPKGHVYLQELEKPEKQCDTLVDCTAAVLDSDMLQALFISGLQNSLEGSIRYSLRWCLQEALKFDKQEMPPNLTVQMFKKVLPYFPYHFDDDFILWGLIDWRDFDDFIDRIIFRDFLSKLLTPEAAKSLSHLSTIFTFHPLVFQLVHYSCAIILIAEYLSVIWSHLKVSSNHILSTVILYQQSSSCVKVMEAVELALSEYQGHFPTPSSDEMDAVLDKLVNQIFQILLDNRLDKSNL